MNKRILAIAVLIIIEIPLLAQGELDEQHKIFFRNEKTFAFDLNSNGWGFNYRYGKRIQARDKHLFEGDFNIVKHHKEDKILSQRGVSLKRFVFGKLHSVFDLKFGYGYQYELFQKADKSSVSVRAFALGGGTLAVMKPIYWDVERADGSGRDTIQFHNEIQYHLIYGTLPYYYGLKEIKLVPGGFLKAGLMVEFSKLDNNFRAVEAGINLQLYPVKLEIMATETNKRFFPTVYLSYRFGKVVSGYHLKEIDEGKR